MAQTGDIALEGGCTCGAVRYRLNDKPMFVHCCHCTWCQRETGTAFAVNALIEGAKVDLLSGVPERIVLPSASGGGQTVSRCADCKVALWSNYAAVRDKVHFIRVGTADDPPKLPPDIHIFTSTKLSWVVLPDGVPAVEAYYRRSEYWPADSVARYNAAKAS